MACSLSHFLTISKYCKECISSRHSDSSLRLSKKPKLTRLNLSYFSWSQRHFAFSVQKCIDKKQGFQNCCLLLRVGSKKGIPLFLYLKVSRSSAFPVLFAWRSICFKAILDLSFTKLRPITRKCSGLSWPLEWKASSHRCSCAWTYQAATFQETSRYFVGVTCQSPEECTCRTFEVPLSFESQVFRSSLYNSLIALPPKSFKVWKSDGCIGQAPWILSLSNLVSHGLFLKRAFSYGTRTLSNLALIKIFCEKCIRTELFNRVGLIGTTSEFCWCQSSSEIRLA